MTRYIVTGLVVILSVGLLAQHRKPAETKQKQTAATANNAAKAYFSIEKKTIDFEKIKMGTSKTVELAFTNTGNKTLVLTDVYTTCGCTTVDWPRDPFLPGKSGTIKLTYNPTEEGPFNKTVTIYTNAENNKEVVQIEGIVIPK
jgi:hypothetical protein